MISQDSLNELKLVCHGVQAMQEGGSYYVFLPGLEVVTNQGTHRLDALLCPSAHPTGYMTRLFLSKPLHGCGQSNNWTEHRILDRNWHTWSWQNVPATQSPTQILAAHLRALR